MSMIQRLFGGLPNCSKIFRTYCTLACGMRSAYDGQFRLLGPPELYRTHPSCPSNNNNNNNNNNDIRVNDVKEEATPKSSTGDPFMDAMMNKYNAYNQVVPPEMMGYTENYSPTYLTSGNPCLDYFFHVVPSTPADQVTKRLESAWEQDPLTALKLVCNLRGVRGTGKNDRKGFYACALWIHHHHPKTLAANVEPIAEFGYFKDLLEILYRLVNGPQGNTFVRKWPHGADPTTYKRKSEEEKRLEAAGKGMSKYNDDPNYRFLHAQVSQLFSYYLKSDMEQLTSGKCNKLSLAAKWCPSLDSSFDRCTLMCESIARNLFPRDKYPEYQGIEDSHYAYRIRDRLRKEVLVPLRRALKLPEVYISAHEWSSIDYSRVASIAMTNYTDLFHKHDEERFQWFLKRVEKGEAKIAAGALLPHQIVNKVRHEDDQVAELQWKTIVEELSALGKLKNCLAICDVSGSMEGEPLDVSVALGLLISELSEEPWKGKLITFSMWPQFQVIQGESLSSKINCIERMHWNMNTNFQRVFDRILEVAIEGKLTEDEMIKRLFVFSDMEFDQASANDWETNDWETDYEAIVRKFNERGFTRVPEIVFWNLRNSSATPVLSHQPGVAMVSGFSKNLIKVFIQEDGCLSPVKTMEAAISGKEYQKLVVVD
ncbi:uncharacterized protein LOC141638225 [Silene latifolia]|uniref:uncharacterized protein LOC141638225 n=1 Tax=Silene latifolia TaxID=37657 RepID=UPI003D77AD1C